MTVETDFFTAVTGDSTISGLISTRLYPVHAPAQASMPLCTYHVISRALYGGRCYRSRLQIDIKDDDYAGVKAIRDGLQTLAENTLHWQYLENGDAYLDKERIWHQSIDIVIT